MALFRWSEKYCTQIPSIDSQHKNLFEIANKLHDAFVERKDDSDIIAKILDELVDYTKYHFSFEEKLMKENRYPHLSEHIEKHRILVTKVSEMVEKYKNKEQIELTDLLVFVIEWLQEHILGEDMEYCPYVMGTTGNI